MKGRLTAVKRVVGIAVLLFFVSVSVSTADTLTLGAAAGYKRMLEKVFRVYEQKTGRKVEQVYGHIGQVIMQAKVGGNVGVILGELAFLKSCGLEFTDFTEVGRGILVLAYKKGVAPGSAEELQRPDIRKIATPDPKQAIYGKAAVEFMQKTGLGGKITNKIVTVATIPQVSSYLISGDVDAGFINKTDALYIKDKIGGWVEVDQGLYSPIHLAFGVRKGFENKPEVKQFLDFLATDREVGEILDKAGIR